MSRLMMVELLRFRSRRAIKVICFGALAIVVAIMVGQFLTHSKGDGTEVERFRAQRAASYERARADWEQILQDPQLPAEQRNQVPTRDEFIAGQEFGCEECVATPESDDFNAASNLQREGVKAVAFIFAFAAFLVGATSAGAEWNAGTMQSLLFWESRRMRVVVAKVAAVVVSMVALVIIGQLLVHALGYLVGTARGTTDGMTTGWWASQALTAGRGIGLVAFAAALGFALSFATRNTGFAFGVAFVYFAIIQQLLVAWKPWLMRYVLVGPMAAWMDKGFRFEFFRESGVDQESVPEVINISMRFGGLALLTYAVVAVALAAVWFRSRDVT